MLRGQKVFFQASKADLDRLYACNRESARVWNECLRLAKEHFLQHGCWITKSEMQKQTKRKFHLHSQSIQAVCHKYLFARKAAHHAIQQGHAARYPYKKKKYFPTKWTKDGFKVYENGKIELSMGIHHGKREKPIVVYASHLPKGMIKEIECCFDQGLYLAVTYEDGQKAKAYKPGSSIGIDLGEVHTIGAFCENGQALLITGRKIRSLHRLRSKKLVEIQRRQSKCQKGSRLWKKYERAKQYVLSKSERQLRDALHKTTKQFVDWCLKQSASDVYIGNVEGVERNTRKKKRTSRKQAQKLSNWSFGKVKKYLAYKLAPHGIRLHEIEESFTSQTCPVCQKRKKVSSRLFVCRCGYEEHRDVHGAKNILSKALHGTFVHWNVQTNLTYLRIA
ncbi:RNA-guided endonuclease InsQ/TnpB family protein [Saccharococcus caldoxylosilyticus]|uniref:RNA-guided endonuclease InsQ/TnpB family protein n=1 Tax=Saccharococcus caldoxylosilyticus TaxID=81408 RepID=UPI0002E15CEF|nr:RNA-guided endonuclease TnpB family protein [Parageobacillus caldoxylosilyticus]